MKKILIAGSSNVDITHIGEFIPDEGQTLMAQSSYLSLGGKGLNQATATPPGGPAGGPHVVDPPSYPEGSRVRLQKSDPPECILPLQLRFVRPPLRHVRRPQAKIETLGAELYRVGFVSSLLRYHLAI